MCARSECCIMCYWFTEMIWNDRTKLFIPQRPCFRKHRTSINPCFGHWGDNDLPNLLWLRSFLAIFFERTLGEASAHLKNSPVPSSLDSCFFSCTDNLVCYTRFKMIGCDGSPDVPRWFTLTRTNLRICMLMSAQPWLLLTVAVAPTSTERISSPSQP